VEGSLTEVVTENDGEFVGHDGALDGHGRAVGEPEAFQAEPTGSRLKPKSLGFLLGQVGLSPRKGLARGGHAPGLHRFREGEG
jgi:hypothetical protein